jgi:phage shock protein PspC (stress-responsive transcriptional regulator)
MRKVTSVNLNGNAYQLDDDAYDLLAAYLGRAQAQLEENPDRAEIVADLEQAIAEKCSRFLGPHKTVIAAPEIRQVIEEMGPVDSGEGEGGAAEAGQAKTAQGKTEAAGRGPKRLYQIREGAMISGVCNGLGAYLDVDVTIVRLAFVGLAILTYGAWILVYAAMMFIVPFADTSEQRAAAYGLSFNAQELIDRAKKKYAGLKETRDKRGWRRRARRREWREWRRAMRQQSRWVAGPPRSVSYPAPTLTLFLVPILGLLELLLFAALAFAIYSLVQTGGIIGWRPPAEIPLWAAILILVALYAVAVSPLVAARHAWYFGGRMHPHAAALNQIVSLVALVAIFWLVYQHVPSVHEFVQNGLIVLKHRVYQ